jgi:L-ascorbate metabolism protein UlaG (beta-lactamase superfamily)
MSVEITATGNAGFHVAAPGASVFIDAFWDSGLRLFGGRRASVAEHLPADLILVTHAHWDHFSPNRVAEAAARTGASVVGPADVASRLRGHVREGALIVLEPPETPGGGPAGSAGVELPGATVTAFRTRHGGGHNSYLVRAGAFSYFHDGDNEDTRPLAPAALAPLDVLFLCPWQGSGWVEFVERVSPRRWFLTHLLDEELDAHAAGRFLPELCDRVPLPDRITALRPGETLTLI